ncbi:hypothetical protein BOX15_Mlig018227g4, partial [Macrostomum lignano]
HLNLERELQVIDGLIASLNISQTDEFDRRLLQLIGSEVASPLRLLLASALREAAADADVATAAAVQVRLLCWAADCATVFQFLSVLPAARRRVRFRELLQFCLDRDESLPALRLLDGLWRLAAPAPTAKEAKDSATKVADLVVGPLALEAALRFGGALPARWGRPAQEAVVRAHLLVFARLPASISAPESAPSSAPAPSLLCVYQTAQRLLGSPPPPKPLASALSGDILNFLIRQFLHLTDGEEADPAAWIEAALSSADLAELLPLAEAVAGLQPLLSTSSTSLELVDRLRVLCAELLAPLLDAGGAALRPCLPTGGQAGLLTWLLAKRPGLAADVLAGCLPPAGGGGGGSRDDELLENLDLIRQLSASLAHLDLPALCRRLHDAGCLGRLCDILPRLRRNADLLSSSRRSRELANAWTELYCRLVAGMPPDLAAEQPPGLHASALAAERIESGLVRLANRVTAEAGPGAIDDPLLPALLLAAPADTLAKLIGCCTQLTGRRSTDAIVQAILSHPLVAAALSANPGLLADSAARSLSNASDDPVAQASIVASLNCGPAGSESADASQLLLLPQILAAAAAQSVRLGAKFWLELMRLVPDEAARCLEGLSAADLAAALLLVFGATCAASQQLPDTPEVDSAISGLAEGLAASTDAAAPSTGLAALEACGRLAAGRLSDRVRLVALCGPLLRANGRVGTGFESLGAELAALTKESAAICVLFIVGCYGGEAGFAYLTANAAIGGSLVPRLTKPQDAAAGLICLSLLDQRCGSHRWRRCLQTLELLCDRGLLDCRATLAAQAADGDRLDDWLVGKVDARLQALGLALLHLRCRLEGSAAAGSQVEPLISAVRSQCQSWLAKPTDCAAVLRRLLLPMATVASPGLALLVAETLARLTAPAASAAAADCRMLADLAEGLRDSNWLRDPAVRRAGARLLDMSS